MAEAVWKQKLAPLDMQSVPLPAGAKIIHVDQQGGFPTFWYVNPDCDGTKTEMRTFQIVGTGHMRGSLGTHLGTFVVGELVFHLFEKTN